MKPSKPDIQQISKCIENQTEPEPFSGVVYVTKGNEVLFAEASGPAIRSEVIPNKIDTRFQIASGSKTFTAVAICRLVQQGKLKFDTRLNECSGIEFPKYAPDITIHHLLTHSSGITSYYDEEINPDYAAVWRDFPMYKMRRPADYLPLFRDKPMKFLPGKMFSYNDGGYVLLGLIIEYVTGLSFSAYIAQNVFKPAGMEDSGYFATDQLPQRTAYAYIKNTDGTWRTNFFAVPIVSAPDGGVYTTAPDMARFWKTLIENKLLSAGLTHQLLTTQIATTWNPPYTGYGYGSWIERCQDTVSKYSLEGSDPGVAFRSSFYPEKDLVLTLIGNTEKALWPLYKKIEEFVIP